MKIQIKNTGEQKEFANGREAVEYLSQAGIIEKPAADKYNPAMVLQRPIRMGLIQVIGGSNPQPPTNTNLFATTEPATDNPQPPTENTLPLQELAAFANLLQKYMNPQLPEPANMISMEEIKLMIKEEIDNAIKEIKPEQIEIKTGTHIHTYKGVMHPEFETLLTLVAAREAVFMSGPAGSGKTTAAHEAAKCNNLPFYSISVCAQTSTVALFGYMDATGKYISTLFYEAYKNGGVFLVDEIDAGNPNVLMLLNAALANGSCAFPCGMINMHPDFVCIAAGNTIGNGGNNQYIGTNVINGATLDRFCNIVWGYDDKLERSLARNDSWVNTVQAYRQKAENKGLRVIISPRASIKGSKLLAIGIEQSKVEDLLIWNKMTATEKNMIK